MEDSEYDMGGPKVYIGTSGWMYKHWNGSFYPRDLKGKAQLPYFAKHFNSVEINSTFYRTPQTSVVENWRDETPKEFVFAIKLNQFITHRKHLILDNESCQQLDEYVKVLEPLRQKTKVLLIQLPPSFKINLERLDIFLAELRQKIPGAWRICCEFRHDSWLEEKTCNVLKKHKAAFVIATYPAKFKSEWPITANMIYIRYHETSERSNYSNVELDKWAGFIESLPANVKTVYLYFNNDAFTHAISNARHMQKKLAKFL